MAHCNAYSKTDILLNILNSFTDTTRKIIIATIAFLAYGYACRLFGLYFFWESKTIGWVLFWIAVIFILRDRINLKRLQSKKILIEKICIGLSVFILIIEVAVFFGVPQTSAFNSAVAFIKTNREIKNKVGTVNGVFLEPFGAMSMSTTSQGSEGQADLHFIVKGSSKYLDLHLLLSKEFDSDWQTQIGGQ